MAYRLEYLPAATKSIEDLPRQMQQRVFQRLEALTLNPRPSGGSEVDWAGSLPNPGW
jgi:mRNA-degrading endonuclease RelE of RelBE toxin-antitoxin system